VTGGGWGLIADQARRECQERRARLLAHPDLARRLCGPPWNFKRPEQWTGFVPPATYGAQVNSSPFRAALVELLTDLEAREREQAEDARASAGMGTDRGSEIAVPGAPPAPERGSDR
jgi:hypothetical protein